jgi:ribosome biogenesis GTP-binding protein YsxC/EngB
MQIKQAAYAGSSIRVGGKPKPLRPEFAFIGRSNVGKSSLINSLAGNGNLAHTSATPGKTQTINHFLINGDWYLVDLPGYGYAKVPDSTKEGIKRTIRDFILNSDELAVLFVLIDSRHELQDIDADFIDWLGEEGIPIAIVFTKCDKMSEGKVTVQTEEIKKKLLETWEELPPVFNSSARSGMGKEEILKYIGTVLKTIKTTNNQ